MSALLDLVVNGSMQGSQIRYLQTTTKSRRGGGEYAFEEVSAPLQKVGTIVQLTSELAGDAAMVNSLAKRQAERGLEDAVVEAVRPVATRVRRWPLVSDSRAIHRAVRRIRRDTGAEYDYVIPRPGEAIVGAFSVGVGVWVQGEPSVEMSNSHMDYFRRGVLGMRTEQRVAVAVFTPEAFAIVRLRTWPRRLRAFLADAFRPREREEDE